jgi:hypothetical protein
MTYRSGAGATYQDVREIPCVQLAGDLDPDAMTAAEDAAIGGEIKRRGAIFENHIGAGNAPRSPDGVGIPVVGCDHSLYPHIHEDIEAFTACQECNDRAAELRIADGT